METIDVDILKQWVLEKQVQLMQEVVKGSKSSEEKMGILAELNGEIDKMSKISEQKFPSNNCHWCKRVKVNPYGLCEHCHRFPPIKSYSQEGEIKMPSNEYLSDWANGIAMYSEHPNDGEMEKRVLELTKEFLRLNILEHKSKIE